MSSVFQFTECLRVAARLCRRAGFPCARPASRAPEGLAAFPAFAAPLGHLWFFAKPGIGGFVDSGARMPIPSVSNRSTAEWTLVDSNRLSGPLSRCAGSPRVDDPPMVVFRGAGPGVRAEWQDGRETLARLHRRAVTAGGR